MISHTGWLCANTNIKIYASGIHFTAFSLMPFLCTSTTTVKYRHLLRYELFLIHSKSSSLSSSSLASALDSSSSLTSRSHQKALRLSASFPMAVEPCYLRRKSSSNTAQSKLKKEKLSWTSQPDWFEEARA